MLLISAFLPVLMIRNYNQTYALSCVQWNPSLGMWQIGPKPCDRRHKGPLIKLKICGILFLSFLKFLLHVNTRYTKVTPDHNSIPTNCNTTNTNIYFPNSLLSLPE